MFSNLPLGDSYVVCTYHLIALSRGVPECTGLGEHTMQRDVKDDLVPKVLRYSPNQEIASISSVSLKECVLQIRVSPDFASSK
ncbi:hypothetical protein Y032_0174g441 [Ancylostoma ceylanicum]|uniref:Uncharacterized protein n=1 Tax=Ancylostoma ceylanicum TaxID=53326 RepID=A0A016SUH4_9BILA|nr:hypothetical protein Y032_0174g441 [Ancylostoma ceylanicum]